MMFMTRKIALARLRASGSLTDSNRAALVIAPSKKTSAVASALVTLIEEERRDLTAARWLAPSPVQSVMP